MMELKYYQARSGRSPFVEWLGQLVDRTARARIEARLATVAAGSFGDAKAVGDGVMELRVDWGPGYRVYFARVGLVVVLLLCGGDKRAQEKDIKRAKEYFHDYKRRASAKNGRRT